MKRKALEYRLLEQKLCASGMARHHESAEEEGNSGTNYQTELRRKKHLGNEHRMAQRKKLRVYMTAHKAQTAHNMRKETDQIKTQTSGRRYQDGSVVNIDTHGW